MSATKASGFVGPKDEKLWTKNSKHGVRYQCTSCGKVVLGMYGASDRMQHYSTCERIKERSDCGCEGAR